MQRYLSESIELTNQPNERTKSQECHTDLVYSVQHKEEINTLQTILRIFDAGYRSSQHPIGLKTN